MGGFVAPNAAVRFLGFLVTRSIMRDWSESIYRGRYLRETHWLDNRGPIDASDASAGNAKI